MMELYIHKKHIIMGTVLCTHKPSKENYLSDGWFTQNNEKIDYSYIITKNLDVYAKYSVDYVGLIIMYKEILVLMLKCNKSYNIFRNDHK